MKAMGIKTLVLDLNDVLVSKHWTRKKGWTLYKRPGAQVWGVKYRREDG